MEKRTEKFSISVRVFVRKLNIHSAFRSDLDQLVRSSGSVGANFLEATEKVGPKDLLFRLRIALKEAKETLYWLKIIKNTNAYEGEIDDLINEAKELKLILASILKKLDKNL